MSNSIVLCLPRPQVRILSNACKKHIAASSVRRSCFCFEPPRGDASNKLLGLKGLAYNADVKIGFLIKNIAVSIISPCKKAHFQNAVTLYTCFCIFGRAAGISKKVRLISKKLLKKP